VEWESQTVLQNAFRRARLKLEPCGCLAQRVHHAPIFGGTTKDGSAHVQQQHSNASALICIYSYIT
jgi:hypothetical protein